VPFAPRTLVDDLEYTLRLVLAGLKVAYCECPVYDEKPETLRASLRQRTRWMRGQAACIVLLGPAILWRAVWRRDLVAWDQWLSLWNPVAMALSVVFFLCTFPLLGVAGMVGWLLFNGGISLGFLARAGVPARRWGHAFCAMIFGFTWLGPVVWGFLSSHRQGWTHTRHVGAGLRPSDVGGVSA
jgi:cellulose synthase/poly-beta-1,6-N-acetylglucosamine synthase-like glycosyltransferase